MDCPAVYRCLLALIFFKNEVFSIYSNSPTPKRRQTANDKDFATDAEPFTVNAAVLDSALYVRSFRIDAVPDRVPPNRTVPIFMSIRKSYDNMRLCVFCWDKGSLIGMLYRARKQTLWVCSFNVEADWKLVTDLDFSTTKKKAIDAYGRRTHNETTENARFRRNK